MSREGAVTLRVPRWAERFTVVKAAIEQFSGEHAEDDELSLAVMATVLRFSSANGDEAFKALEDFVNDAKIAHDIQSVRWVDGADEITTNERDRWAEEVVHPEFGSQLIPVRREWNDQASMVDALDLHRLMKVDGIDSVRKRLNEIADQCGSSQPAIDKIAAPDEAMLFTMALWTKDLCVLRELGEARPQLLHGPMRHMHCGQIPLNWAVENDHLEVVSELLRLGARSSHRQTFSDENAIDLVRRRQKDLDPKLAQLILAAAAHEAAQAALAEMALPMVHSAPREPAPASTAAASRP